MNNNAADPQAEAVAELKKWVAVNKQALVAGHRVDHRGV